MRLLPVSRPTISRPRFRIRSIAGPVAFGSGDSEAVGSPQSGAGGVATDDSSIRAFSGSGREVVVPWRPGARGGGSVAHPPASAATTHRPATRTRFLTGTPSTGAGDRPTRRSVPPSAAPPTPVRDRDRKSVV